MSATKMDSSRVDPASLDWTEQEEEAFQQLLQRQKENNVCNPNQCKSLTPGQPDRD